MRLRRPDVGDLGAIVRIHCDPRTNRFRPGGAPSPEEAAGYLAAWQAHWDRHGFGYWAVEAPVATGEEPGVVGFGGVVLATMPGRRALNLYFRLDPSAWGRGVANGIGRSALTEAFERQGAELVIGKVRPANHPSRRALERLGLRLSGAVDDVPGSPASLLYEIDAARYATRT